MNATKGESADINLDIPCRECGEMVRKGSVRCRECGTFLDPETEQKAREIAPLSSLAPVDNFALTENTGDGEDDFEVGPGVTTFEANESAFELAMDALDSADENEFAITQDPLTEEGSEWDAGSDAIGEALAEASAELADPASPSSAAPRQETGDPLLDGALEEEAESKSRHGGRTIKPIDIVPESGVVVYCPSGHRIHVEDRFRGRTGRCPQCRAPFMVPGTPSAESLQQAEAQETGEESQEEEIAILFPREDSGRYELWMPDIKLHRVMTSKLRLKAGSLADESETVDVGFAEDAILIVTVFKGKGGLTSRSAQRKKPELRAEVFEHLEATKKKSDPGQIPAPFYYRIKPDQFERIWIAQPAPPRGESLFADLDLFGEGVIAVRLPEPEECDERLYITPTLSQYRELARLLAEKYEVILPSDEHGIPLVDEFGEVTCHYSSQTMTPLKHVEYYESDPLLEIELIGRQCQVCETAISESARVQEKLGGKSGSGIAKAKCPSCGQKFGSKSLYNLKANEGAKSDSETTAAATV